MITFHQHRKRWITVPVPTTQQSLNRAVDELRDESLTYESENRPLTHIMEFINLLILIYLWKKNCILF